MYVTDRGRCDASHRIFGAVDSKNASTGSVGARRLIGSEGRWPTRRQDVRPWVRRVVAMVISRQGAHPGKEERARGQFGRRLASTARLRVLRPAGAGGWLRSVRAGSGWLAA